MRTWFGLNMVAGLGMACAMSFVTSFLPLSAPTKQGLNLLYTKFAFKLAITLSPWIWISAAPGTKEEIKKLVKAMKDSDKDGKPVIVLGNHTSFLDTVLFVALCPMSVLWRTRTFMSAHLFSLPLLSTMCKAIGHFPVHFLKGEYGKFSLNQEKMGPIMERAHKHLDDNNVLCLFPEGQQNKTPEKLLPFRYGTFKIAKRHNAKLWGWCTINNEKSWPLKSQIGGLPAYIRHSLVPIAPEGFATLAAKLKKSDEETDDYKLVAEHSRSVMQGCFDKIAGKVSKKE